MVRSTIQPRVILILGLALVLALSLAAPASNAQSNTPKLDLPKVYKGSATYSKRSIPTPGDTVIETTVSVTGLKLKRLAKYHFWIKRKKHFGFPYSATAGTVTVRIVMSGACVMDKFASFPIDGKDPNHADSWLAIYEQGPAPFRYHGEGPHPYRSIASLTGTAICEGFPRETQWAPENFFDPPVTKLRSTKKLVGSEHADYQPGEFEDWAWNLKAG